MPRGEPIPWDVILWCRVNLAYGPVIASLTEPEHWTESTVRCVYNPDTLTIEFEAIEPANADDLK